MYIPKYVQDMMRRSEYNYSIGDTGYTLDIHKRSRCASVESFKTEILSLVQWANRHVSQYKGFPIAEILHCPRKTRKSDQIATVTIYDPVMQELESFIGDKLEYPKHSCRICNEFSR